MKTLKIVSVCFAAALLVVVWSTQAPAADETILQEEWYKIYLSDAPAGHMAYRMLDTEYEGSSAYKLLLKGEIEVTRLNTPMKVSLQYKAIVTLDYLPLYVKMLEKNSMYTKVTEVYFTDNAADATVKLAGSARDYHFDFDEDTYVSSSLLDIALVQKLSKNENVSRTVFSPELLRTGTETITHKGTAAIDYKAAKMEVSVVEHDLFGIKTNIYVDDTDTIIKAESNTFGFPITVVKTDKEDALERETAGSFDFAADMSVHSNLTTPLYTDTVDSLKFIVKETSKSNDTPSANDMLVDDAHQRKLTEDDTIYWETSYPSFDADDAPALPITEEALEKYLAPTTYAQSDNPDIVKKAAEIVGDETNSYKALEKIVRWVFNNLKSKNYTVGFASATETLKTLAGDCTEHSLLASALAKAAGIPTRVAVGIVLPPLSRDGKFFYHMWVEAYVGEWVAVDPTFDEMKLDPFHIKLAQGISDEENRSFFTLGMIPFLGKIEIVGVSYTIGDTEFLVTSDSQ